VNYWALGAHHPWAVHVGPTAGGVLVLRIASQKCRNFPIRCNAYTPAANKNRAEGGGVVSLTAPFMRSKDSS
jgi:hypothetical protein